MNRFLSLCFLLFLGTVYAQQADIVDFERIKAELSFEGLNKVSGFVFINFKTLEDVDSVYLDAMDMDFRNLKLSDRDSELVAGSDYRVEADKIVILNNFKKNTDYL
ncbi:MAG: hypothetical protein WA749_00415, partial [Gelidibacter sp.]